MAIIDVNGSAGAYARVSIPRCGRRQAQVILADDTEINLGAPVTLSLEGVPVLTGTVVRAGTERSLPKLWLQDAAGLSKELPAKFYRGGTEALVARDILSESGHSGEVVLPASASFYSRMAGSGCSQLADLLDAGALWRTKANGQVYVGPERWEKGITLTWGETLTGLDALQKTLFAVLSVQAEPGTVITADPNGEEGEFKVQRVQHLVDGKRLETTLWI